MNTPKDTTTTQPDPTDFPGWRTYIDQAPVNSQARVDRLNDALRADVPIGELLKNRDRTNGMEAA